MSDNPSQKYETIAIIGPTASGKTGRAVSIAEAINGEIISADSRQVYKDMDLGTGKDLEEYNTVPYHLIDICEAGEKYNLYRYLHDFKSAFEEIKSRNNFPVICGGTGMYVETALSGIALPDVPENKELRNSLQGKTLPELVEILKGYKVLHNITDVDTEKRAIRAIEIEEFYKNNVSQAIAADRKKASPLKALIIGIDISREDRRQRITSRLKKRLDEGMVEEVRRLLDKGVNPEDLIYYGLEYKYLTLYAIGELTYNEMCRQLEIAIHQFAKRQMTWFRGMERRGFKINWLPYDMSDEAFTASVLSLLHSDNPTE